MERELTQTEKDTQRAQSRTFERRSFMIPPRPRIEDEGERDIYHHAGIARDRFSDSVQDDVTPQASELPTGAAGDVLYHNGTSWVVLTKPASGGNAAVLRHNGTAPYWEKPVDCS